MSIEKFSVIKLYKKIYIIIKNQFRISIFEIYSPKSF